MCGFPCALEVDVDPARIVLRDRQSGLVEREWGGRIARHIISSGILPRYYCRAGSFLCDKILFWHVALAVTAAELSLHRLAEPGCDSYSM